MDLTIGNLVRTMSSFFRIGSLRLKDSAGVLEVRNGADSAYGSIRANSVEIASGGALAPQYGGTGSNLAATGPGTLIQAANGANITILKHNLIATTNPTTGDDSGDGYSVSSVWINTMTPAVFICAANTLGAAVWVNVSVNYQPQIDTLDGRLDAVDVELVDLDDRLDIVESVPPGSADASTTSYTPTTLADWDGGIDPGQVLGALDQAAERITDLEAVPAPNYQTIQDDGVDKTQRGKLNFASTATVLLTVTDDGGSNKSTVTADLVGGGSGAPTTSKYIVTEADAGLSAEIVIPKLAGSIDRIMSAPGGFDYHYDSGVSPFTWTAAPTTENINSTVPSCLYVNDTVANTPKYGTVAWTPGAVLLDFSCHIALHTETSSASQIPAAGLWVSDSSAGSAGGGFQLQITRSINGQPQISAGSYNAGAFTARGTTVTWGNTWAYLRFVRTAASVWHWYVSSEPSGGWVWLSSLSYAFTVAKVGYRITSGATGTTSFGFRSDWFRSNV